MYDEAEVWRMLSAMRLCCVLSVAVLLVVVTSVYVVELNCSIKHGVSLDALVLKFHQKSFISYT